MGSIDRRLGDLERLVEPPQDAAAERCRLLSRDILDEFARLKASRAVHYRGGVRADPEDIPGRILGPGYTTGQMWELAERLVLERGEVTA